MSESKSFDDIRNLTMADIAEFRKQIHSALEEIQHKFETSKPKDFEGWSEKEKEKFRASYVAAELEMYVPIAEAMSLYDLIHSFDEAPLPVLYKAIENAKPSPKVILFLLLEVEKGFKERLKEEKRTTFMHVRDKGTEANKRKAADNNEYIQGLS